VRLGGRVCPVPVFDEEIDAKFEQLRVQWNIAERRIKKAEQVCGGKIVASAIFELRYAGRKHIDALELLFTQDWKTDQTIRHRILEFLDDAIEDCVKAKHDAIDAMMDFITVWFAKIRESLKLANIQKFFPNFLQTRALIVRIQRKIEESRGDRTKLRDSM
jgi:hypothetical protein